MRIENDTTFGNNNASDYLKLQKCLHNSENNLKFYKQTWIKYKYIYWKSLISMCHLFKVSGECNWTKRSHFEKWKNRGFCINRVPMQPALSLVGIYSASPAEEQKEYQRWAFWPREQAFLLGIRQPSGLRTYHQEK